MAAGTSPAATTALAIGVSAPEQLLDLGVVERLECAQRQCIGGVLDVLFEFATRIGQRAVGTQQAALHQPILIVAPLVLVVVTAAHDHLLRDPPRRRMQHVGLAAGQP